MHDWLIFSQLHYCLWKAHNNEDQLYGWQGTRTSAGMTIKYILFCSRAQLSPMVFPFEK